MDVTRAQVVAHRVAAQGLLRDRPLDALLDLGVQDTGPSARLALAARDARPVDTVTIDPAAHGLVDAWTHRGAPHHHRPGDLPALAASTCPRSDADAAARLAWSGPRQRAVGISAAEAIARVADAVAEVVAEPLTKGAASAAITARLPDALLTDCRPCGSTHVGEQLLRLAALPAGVTLDATGTTLLLLPPPSGWSRPELPADTRRLVAAHLRVLGPATPADVAAFLGTTERAWGGWSADDLAGGLAEVRVEGRPAWLPVDDVDALAHAPDPDAVRLLPPSDPLLAGRDRETLVPDEAHRKELYRAIGNPGAVLADGEIVGSWRPRSAGRRLTITVTAFTPLPSDVRARLDDEAERVAAAQGRTLAALSVG